MKPSWAAMKLTRAGRGRREDVARAGERGGEARRRMCGVAAPEAAHPVAVAVVPLEPGRREAPELVAARADVPGLGDQHAVGEQRVGGDLAQERRAAGRSRAAVRPRIGGEVEAEAVDAGLADEVAQRVEHQPPRRRVVAGERVAGAGVVDQPPVAARGGSRRGRRGRAGESVGPWASLSPVWLKTTSRITADARRRAAPPRWRASSAMPPGQRRGSGARKATGL